VVLSLRSIGTTLPLSGDQETQQFNVVFIYFRHSFLLSALVHLLLYLFIYLFPSLCFCFFFFNLIILPYFSFFVLVYFFVESSLLG